MSATIGQPVVRKDGRDKVTGRARYAADNRLPRMAYGALVRCTVASGRLLRLHTESARAVKGFLGLLTSENAPRLHPPGTMQSGGEFAEHFFPVQDDRIYYWGQYIGVAVAETWEGAEEAAALVSGDYERESAALDMEHAGQVLLPEKYMGREEAQKHRGDLGQAKAAAAHVVEGSYRTPYLHHNALEMHATLAEWTEEGLTVYEPTQWVMGLRSVLSKSLGLPPEKVRVISPFVGGGFGSKGFTWPQSVLAALAARQVKRPVKLVLTRAEMFTGAGHRGPTRQDLMLAADSGGRLRALRHATLTQTSIKNDFFEPAGLLSAMLYSCPNLEVSHRAARLNTGSPCPTRAPGEAPGSFALESAMDELAVASGLDPIELRVRNHAAEDPEKRLPWSSKHLLECYRVGAERFDWKRRDPLCRSMRTPDGRLLGMGMATATYPGNKRAAKASVRLSSDGTALVRSATHDLGTGTYTTLAQVAAEELGLPVEKVRCEIGDSTLPEAGVSGGSSTSASVAPAVQQAARRVREGALRIAPGGETDPLAALRAAGRDALEAEGETESAEGKKPTHSFHSFGAQFAEVWVDPRTFQLRVAKVVTVIDAGRILNRLTARSQIQGGVVWGIGMALLEHTELDQRTGQPVTRNLADYLVPVNADVPDITVEFIEYPDTVFNPVGVRGIGEIGITGITAALANAVYHATGVRVRSLPITLDKLLV